MPDRSHCRLRALGMVCALGSEPDEIWEGLARGDTGRLRERGDFVPGRTLRVGEVDDELPAIPARLARYACRNNALALAALLRIEADVLKSLESAGPGGIGVVIGTSTSGVSDAEAALRHRRDTDRLAPEFHYAQLEFGGVAGFVADFLSVGGPAYALSTACSSGARALASARSLLRLGLCDAVIAGAVDTLCGLTTNGFHALQAIAPGVTNPMSRERDGLTLGEGAALFLLTREPGGVQLAGVGASSEAHHMSAPDPEGRGAEAAMREALADAGLEPSDVHYVNLHGTGTPQNDRMEGEAVARVFGCEVPVGSTKPLVGHTLGAAGALEAGFCWLALARASRERGLPLIPHVWDGRRDPEIPPVRLASKGECAPLRDRAVAVSNSFGFGGNNCTLVLTRTLG
jgi:3-oxoacyl-[acyl-carrier-protein] synthase-1